jgi:hypothetical protein
LEELKKSILQKAFAGELTGSLNWYLRPVYENHKI